MKKGLQRDLAIGRVAEDKIVKLYDSLGCISLLNKARDELSHFDMTTKLATTRGELPLYYDSEFSTEVKYDIYANRSGNIAIETFNPKTGKPSGIGITTADIWAHIVDDIYLTSVRALKEHVETVKPFRLIEAGGDNNATLFLYKKEDILSEIFINFSVLEPDEGREKLVELLNSV